MSAQSYGPYLQLFEPRSIYYPEKRLQYAWKKILWKEPARTLNGQKVSILFPGRQNPNEGPDFLGARLIIDGNYTEGDIEIHYQAGEWYRHGHHRDGNYNNVRLHVIFRDEKRLKSVTAQNGKKIETLHIPLEWVDAYPFENKCKTGPVDSDQYFEILKENGWKRIRQKIVYFRKQFNYFPLDLMFYWGLFKACGYRFNEKNMVDCFLRFPWNDFFNFKIPPPRLEKICFELAGFGDDRQSMKWIYSKIRPAHFPDRRLAWLGQFMKKHYYTNIVESMAQKLSVEKYWNRVFDHLFSTETPYYWRHHLRFGTPCHQTPKLTPGRALQKEIILNTLFPLIKVHCRENGCKANLDSRIDKAINTAKLSGIYGKTKIFHQIHGISDHDPRRRLWVMSQGVLYIRNSFCSRDLEKICPICALVKESADRKIFFHSQ